MRAWLRLAVAAALAASAGAAQAPGFSDSDRRLGAEANPQLTAQYGGALSGPQAAYVRDVGQRIAAQSGMAARPQDYTVTLLNSNVNNAFAIPGGYVYVTRQLVALMNDEAELAFVMGHEVGHVAARHSQKRQDRSGLLGIGAAILGAVTGSDVVGSLAGSGAQLLTLSYSRDQEREADSLGVRYLARAGYDPAAGADILASLGAQTELEQRLAGQSGQQPAGWLSTHPATAERVEHVRREAGDLAAGAGARATNRDAFLNAIDGMVYDDDPAQGVVQGRSFRHAGLRLAFDAPPGFALQNTPSAVIGQGNGGQFKLEGGKLAAGASLEGYVAQLWQALSGGSVQPGELARETAGGLERVVLRKRASSNGRPLDVTLAAWRWSDGQALHMVTIVPAGRDAGFDQLIASVRRMSAEEAAAIRARRIAVVRVQPGDTVRSLAGRMAYDDDRLARFTVLNGLTADTPLRPGDRVKLVVFR